MSSERVAWVTGGVKGLGVMVVKGLIEDGYRVVVNYRNSEKEAKRLQEEMARSGKEISLLQGDGSDATSVKQMVSRILDTYGGIDVLVCMTGPFYFKPIPVTEYTDSQWRQMIDGNLSSVFYATREVIPVMREQAYGRIITVGFSGAEQGIGMSGYGPYTAAKVGLVSLTRTLALEEAQHGITVNMICPGDIRDPYKELTIARAREEAGEEVLTRSGTGEDIAQVVCFLSHPDSDLITGAMIPVG